MDEEFDGLRFKQTSKDSAELNFFNNFDADLAPFDFEYESKRDNMFFKDLIYDKQDASALSASGGKVNLKPAEVKKSISYGNLASQLKAKKKINRAESCMNLQELKNLPHSKKPNSKNIFIQKIQGLLKDNLLVDKIETDNK